MSEDGPAKNLRDTPGRKASWSIKVQQGDGNKDCDILKLDIDDDDLEVGNPFKGVKKTKSRRPMGRRPGVVGTVLEQNIASNESRIFMQNFLKCSETLTAVEIEGYDTEPEKLEKQKYRSRHNSEGSGQLTGDEARPKLMTGIALKPKNQGLSVTSIVSAEDYHSAKSATSSQELDISNSANDLHIKHTNSVSHGEEQCAVAGMQFGMQSIVQSSIGGECVPVHNSSHKEISEKDNASVSLDVKGSNRLESITTGAIRLATITIPTMA